MKAGAGSIRALGVLGLWILFSSTALADSFTFTTIPASGNVSATAGSTVGWGYLLTNLSSTRWLSAWNIGSGLFANGTPDASVFDFPILAPGGSVSLPYDGLLHLGLFEFTWDPSAPVGFANSGNFVLSADWYDGDPLNGGNFIEPALDASAAYSVTVAAASVPEPSALLLLASGLGFLPFLNRQRRFPILR